VRRVVTAAIVSSALLGAALVAPAAQAAPCDGVGEQQPFLAWHDQASYVLVDGGDFETAAGGWTLEGGAATAAGGNPLRPDSSATALSLPAGSSATSPPICVGKGNPTARLFTRTAALAASERAALGVEVLYLNAAGDVRKVKKAGALRPKDSWGPTRKFSLAQGQFAHAKPETTPPGLTDDHGNGPPEDHGNGNGPPEDHGPGSAGHGHGGGSQSKGDRIALRFTPVAGSSWLIDDVFVDPRMRL
jgi:hypothetical protein